MSRKKNNLISPSPIVKWVGGKRQLLDELKKRLPKLFGRYFEPFAGGAALLFDLQPSKATISDDNEELINLYLMVKDQVEVLIAELKTYKNEEEFFYKVRQKDREPLFEQLSKVERAARIHYLNKTCYNGLFRVNNTGEFNSPFGRYQNPDFVNEVALRAVSKYLNNNDIKIICGDFELGLAEAGKGDFVYLDPPYDPVSDSANFTGYTRGGFNQQHQQRLKEECDRLTERGVLFLLSNSATDFIKGLYRNNKYTIETINAKRAINCKASERGDVEELLIRNYA